MKILTSYKKIIFMKTTSHFIWIQLKSEIFSDIFSAVYLYLEQNNIQNSIVFQNPLSPHITLYYLEKDIDQVTKEEIKKYIQKFDIKNSITISWYDYFLNWEWNKSIFYFTTKKNLLLEAYRNDLDDKYNRNHVENNSFTFSPHITFLRIQDNKVFKTHRQNIENIINKELQKINNLDINTKNIFLYAVNSQFKEEIQVKL